MRVERRRSRLFDEKSWRGRARGILVAKGSGMCEEIEGIVRRF